jgi:hypothetical protein
MTCPICGTANAKRNFFCGKCGELIQIDPGIAKMARKVNAEDRERNRAKNFTRLMVALAVLGFLGYQITSRLITAAVQKVTPVLQAQIESDVERNVKAKLPVIETQALQQVATRVGQQVADKYVQAARQEFEKVQPDVQVRFAAIEADEEAKLRNSYQQAQANNIQTLSSVTTLAWSGTPGNVGLPIAGANMPTNNFIVGSAIPTLNAIVGSGSVITGANALTNSINGSAIPTLNSIVGAGSMPITFCSYATDPICNYNPATQIVGVGPNGLITKQ